MLSAREHTAVVEENDQRRVRRLPIGRSRPVVALGTTARGHAARAAAVRMECRVYARIRRAGRRFEQDPLQLLRRRQAPVTMAGEADIRASAAIAPVHGIRRLHDERALPLPRKEVRPAASPGSRTQPPPDRKQETCTGQAARIGAAMTASSTPAGRQSNRSGLRLSQVGKIPVVETERVGPHEQTERVGAGRTTPSS